MHVRLKHTLHFEMYLGLKIFHELLYRDYKTYKQPECVIS